MGDVDLKRIDFIQQLVDQKSNLAARNGTYGPNVVAGRTVDWPRIRPDEMVALTRFWFRYGSRLEKRLRARRPETHAHFSDVLNESSSRILTAFQALAQDSLLIALDEDSDGDLVTGSTFQAVSACSETLVSLPFYDAELKVPDPECFQFVWDQRGDAGGYVTPRIALTVYFHLNAIARAASTGQWSAANVKTDYELVLETLGPLAWIVSGWEVVFETVGRVGGKLRKIAKWAALGALGVGGVYLLSRGAPEAPPERVDPADVAGGGGLSA